MPEEQKTRFTFADDLAAMSVEDALERKKSLTKARRDSETTLETLLIQQQRTIKDNYLSSDTTLGQFWNEVKEFFGYGRSYQFDKNLRALGIAVSQADKVAKNSQALCAEYADNMTEVRASSMHDKELFALNIIVYDRKNAQLAEKHLTLESMHKQSLLGTAGTTEAMALEREVLSIQNDLAQLDVENDTLAVTLTVAQRKIEATQTLYNHLRTMSGILSEQHAVAEGHYQLGIAQQKLLNGTKGIASARLVYEQAGIAVARFKKFQQDSPDIASVSFDEKFSAPALTLGNGKDDGTRYWRTAAPKILGEAYHSNGNGRASSHS